MPWVFLSKTTYVPWEVFSFNRVNFVKPVHESDKLLFESTTFLLHDVQISVSRPCYINVFQWKRDCSFLRHIELNSRSIVVTIDEVTLDRPEVGTGFSVICCFCKLRLSRFAFTENFALFGLLPSGGGFSEFVLPS